MKKRKEVSHAANYLISTRHAHVVEDGKEEIGTDRSGNAVGDINDDKLCAILIVLIGYAEQSHCGHK